MRARLLTCPNGHEWHASEGAALTVCPVCSSEGQVATPSASQQSSATTPLANPRSGETETLAGPTSQLDRDWPSLTGYVCLAKLGEGGMGVVFKARQTNLRRMVAIKTLKAGIHASRTALARFYTEAEAVAALQHPHIVHIYEVGEQEGRPYFSMEYVAGGSLDQRIEEGPLELREAARLVEKLAGAMHHAHERGIIHRDLKPANVLLVVGDSPSHDDSGRSRVSSDRSPASNATPHASPATTRSDFVLPYEPKIADFGLAKRLEEELGMTMPEERLGTPAYMAPEQREGRHAEVGPATDVYALGAILYECVTGHRPLRDSDGPATVSPVYYRPLPRDLETIILKCLRAEPVDRYHTAAALADDLRRFLAGEPIHGRRIGLLRRTTLWAKRRPFRAGLVILAILLSAAGGVWLRSQYLYVWESTTYYKQFVKQYGVPIGIGELDGEQVGHRFYSYKFVRAGQQGRLKYLEIVNGHGHPTWNHESAISLEGIRENLPQNARECRYQFDYDEQGDVIQETGYNVAGERIWRLNYFYSDSPTGDRRRQVKARFHNAEGDLVCAPSGANTTLFLRNTDGLDERLSFFDSDGEIPRCDVLGNFGYRFEYDARKRYRHVANLDPAGNAAANVNGVISIDLAYDAADDVVEVQFAWGEPSPPPERQVRRQTSRYDAFGNLEEQRCLNDQGEPTQSDAGWAVRRMRYEQSGNQIGIEFLNENLETTNTSSIKYDEMGYPTENALATVAQKPPTVAYFDRRGNKVKEVHQPLGNAPTTTTTWQYNALGRPIERREWAADGTTLLSRTVFEYGRRGKVAAELRYGPDDKLQGKTVWVYSPQGNLLEEQCFDGDGKLQRCAEGYSQRFKKYDEQGRLNLETLTGIERPDGVVKIGKTYDRLGRITEESYWNEMDEPQRTRAGYERATYTFGDAGRRVETTFWGHDGLRGFKRALQTIDLTTMRNQMTFADDEGKPVRTKEGYTTYIMEFTPEARLKSETYSGYDGSAGFQSYTMDYNEAGQQKSWTGEGFDGRRGFAKMRRTLDDRGRFITETYFDEQLQPVPCKNGYASFTCDYDREGLLVGVRFADRNNKPLEPKLHVVARILLPDGADRRPGLQAGDRIVTYNGQPIPVGLALLNEQQRLGERTDDVALEIERDGRRQTLQVRPGRLGIILEEVLDAP